MRTMVLILVFLSMVTTHAQFAVRYLGPNTNGIAEDFPSEVRERVEVGVIPQGFHTNITRIELEALQVRTFPAMIEYHKRIQDTNDLARRIIAEQIELDKIAIVSALTNWTRLTAQQRTAIDLARIRLEANKIVLEQGDIEVIRQRSTDTNSTPVRTQ